MALSITKDEVFDFLKNGGSAIGNLALRICGESLGMIGADAFSAAIGIGIENTFAALYDANVPDKEIIRVVCAQWGLEQEDAENRLVHEKRQAAIRSLKQYLKLQGYSQDEIHRFMSDNRAYSKIRYDKELWKLKNDPQKLMKAVQA